MLRFAYLIAILLVSCTDGCNKAEKNEVQDTDSQFIDNNPRTADSITPVSLKDTAGLTEYAKDSLIMCAAFQRSANKMSKTIKERDALGYAAFTPPNILQNMGGKTGFVVELSKRWSEEKSTVQKVISGPVKRVSAAIDDEGYSHGWYCLIPVRRYVVENGNVVEEQQWFGGQTLDFGKTCYFINITGLDKASVMAIMPDLRFVLDAETLP